MTAALSLLTTYAHLLPDGTGRLEPVTETFWPDLMADRRPDLDEGRLVMVMDGDSDWPTWERHPAGEELVMLLAGQATLLLEAPDGVTTHPLTTPGDYVLIPRGLWHTAKIAAPCRLLFITPGRGTENRPV